MSDSPHDVRYALLLMGLAADTPVEIVYAAVADAKAYRYATKDRIRTAEMVGHYIMARLSLGAYDAPFTDIRKAYHHKAKELHPDRTHGDAQAEERLKTLNAAFDTIETLERSARDHDQLPLSERQEIERAAREARRKESPNDALRHETNRMRSAEPASPHTPSPHTSAPQPAAGGMRYYAASVPRMLRNARLSYVSPLAVIGSRFVQTNNGAAVVYDIIMLPEREFLRARHHLGMPGTISRDYSMSGLTPVFIPQDTQQFTVAEGNPDPHNAAKAHFMKLFGL